MRKVIHQQLNLGETGIPEIEIDLKSRDDIPQVLLGLQYIYESPKLREKVFTVLIVGGNSNVYGARRRNTDTSLPFIIVMIIEPSPFVAAPLYLHRICPKLYLPLWQRSQRKDF